MSLKTWATFDGGANPLPELCHELLSEQQKTWQDLREGYNSLKKVRERDLNCRDFVVRLQYNPGRMKSSTARVSATDEGERNCFLCLDHLPKNQKGILYRNDYLILCNPMPVFPSHFTVSHIDHRPQAIADHFDIFLQIMADFGAGWRVLYNGPRCGASAPHHLHFQVVPSRRMAIERETAKKKRFILMKPVEGVLLYRLGDLGREAILLEGKDEAALARVFNNFQVGLKKVLIADQEPMMNIIGLYEEKKWRLLIFPRRKHRPDAFFRQGRARIVVSPGVIDMGGLLITPVEKDFERLDRALVEAIYEEVSLEGKIVKEAITLL